MEDTTLRCRRRSQAHAHKEQRELVDFQRGGRSCEYDDGCDRSGDLDLLTAFLPSLYRRLLFLLLFTRTPRQLGQRLPVARPLQSSSRRLDPGNASPQPASATGLLTVVDRECDWKRRWRRRRRAGRWAREKQIDADAGQQPLVARARLVTHPRCRQRDILRRTVPTVGRRSASKGSAAAWRCSRWRLAGWQCGLAGELRR